VAIVLGGGGFKGISHVGVLKELEDANIPIDLIVGCSAGSVVGALYADHPDASYVKEILAPLKAWDILDINIFRCRYGLVRGASLVRFLNRHLAAHCFEDLQIPLCIVATDLIEGTLVSLSSGSIASAVHASSAVPFLFSPVYLHQRWLVDGGVIDPVPVRVAKEHGATIVIAVDLSSLLPKTCPCNLFGVATRSAEIALLLQSEHSVEGAEIVIRPALRSGGIFDDRNQEKAYEAGREAARDALPQIMDLLLERGIAI
jgi:NTE family protein